MPAPQAATMLSITLADDEIDQSGKAVQVSSIIEYISFDRSSDPNVSYQWYAAIVFSQSSNIEHLVRIVHFC